MGGFEPYNFSQELVGLLNACIVVVFNQIYGFVGLKLTQFENHRDYETFLESSRSSALHALLSQFLHFNAHSLRNA